MGESVKLSVSSVCKAIPGQDKNNRTPFQNCRAVGVNDIVRERADFIWYSLCA